ncbi:MAG TPA: hypothetical protein VKE74_35410 [Gemmataceae bacterium]|nr:hypothetical protein [Gemmataceae bacterium]
MVLLSLFLLAPADPDDTLAKKMLPIYQKEVETYSLAVESDPKKALELKKEPVFEWLNPARGDQQGAVFLWLHDGRPAALACIFSHRHEKLPGRQIMHELHALDPEKLIVKRDEYNQWKPEAGLARKELPDSPTPAATAGARLLQMKKLAQEFTGYSVDRDAKRWELRLLPAPLYRYPEAKTGVIDGGLFALVSTAGTDPEVLLVIEAREKDGKLRWEYACGRFSDWELRVQRNEKEVFSSVPDEKTNPFFHGPQHLYRIYPEKVVTPEGKLLAKIRSTPKMPWGEVIPVEDK